LTNIASNPEARDEVARAAPLTRSRARAIFAAMGYPRLAEVLGSADFDQVEGLHLPRISAWAPEHRPLPSEIPMHSLARST
jgi:hypothetical protein